MDESPSQESSSDAAWSKVRAIDAQVAHLWMVRTFLKHADEAEDDEELRDVVRDLYDFILALGPMDEVSDPNVYLKAVKKKISKLASATKVYEDIQPEVSGHTNFVMAAKSLRLVTDAIASIIRKEQA
jgi:hypothetical protein